MMCLTYSLVVTKAVKLRLTCQSRHWVGDNTRIWEMHCLNLGKAQRINLLFVLIHVGGILSSGLVRIYMLTTLILYTKYEIQV